MSENKKSKHWNSFNFVGSIFEKKDDRKEFSSKNSDWKMTKFIFGMKSNGSYQTLSVVGGHKGDQTPLYYFDAQNKQRNMILFKDRHEIDMDKVAPFSLYTINLNPYSRKQLEFFLNHPTKAEETGLTIEAVTRYLNNYDENYFKYLSPLDFMNKLKDLLKNPEISKQKFQVSGDVVFSRNGSKTYIDYQVRQIRATNHEEQSFAYMNFFFDEDSMDDVEEDGSFMVNGYTETYDSKEKRYVFYPYSFKVPKIIKNTPEEETRANNFRRRRFKVEGDHLKECVLVIDVVNKTNYRYITEEDLSEDERDALFCGEVTLEELRREYRPIAQGTVRENRFVKMGTGYTSGAAETDWTTDDLFRPQEAAKNLTSKGSDVDDLFLD